MLCVLGWTNFSGFFFGTATYSVFYSHKSYLFSALVSFLKIHFGIKTINLLLWLLWMVLFTKHARVFFILFFTYDAAAETAEGVHSTEHCGGLPNHFPSDDSGVSF